MPQPLDRASSHACRDSVTELIWFTLGRRQLQDLSIRLGLATVRSSSTVWMPALAVNLLRQSLTLELTKGLAGGSLCPHVPRPGTEGTFWLHVAGQVCAGDLDAGFHAG